MQNKTVITTVIVCVILGVGIFIAVACLLCCYGSGKCCRRRKRSTVPLGGVERLTEGNDEHDERVTRIGLRRFLRS